VLGGTGDMFAQVIEGTDRIDAKRTACACAWYGPAALMFWTPYMAWQERLFGSSGLRSVLCKVAGYNLAIATVDISGFHLVSLTPQVGLQKAALTLHDGYLDALTAGLCLWLPTMTLIYWRMPAHLVLSTSYAVDVIWASTMSYLSNRRKQLVVATEMPATKLAPSCTIPAPGGGPEAAISSLAWAPDLVMRSSVVVACAEPEIQVSAHK